MDTYEKMLAPASEANPRYGEGSVITLGNGDLFVAYSEFYSKDQGDMGAAHVLARISKDRGRTWGSPFELVANDCVTVFSVSLLRLPSGRILLAYCRKEAVGEGAPDVQGVKNPFAGLASLPLFRAL